MHQSIAGFGEAIKRGVGQYAPDLFVPIVVILVGLSAFGLGRLSALEHVPPVIHMSEESPGEIPPKNAAKAPGELSPENTAKVSGELLPDTAQTPGTQAASAALASPEAGSVVASKSGTKYHLPWCPGAKSIKEENKIWFSTAAEAENAGYTKAANCKGL